MINRHHELLTTKHIFYFVNACSSIVYCYFSSTECIQIKQTPAVKQKHNPMKTHFLLILHVAFTASATKDFPFFVNESILFPTHSEYLERYSSKPVSFINVSKCCTFLLFFLSCLQNFSYLLLPLQSLHSTLVSPFG